MNCARCGHHKFEHAGENHLAHCTWHEGSFACSCYRFVQDKPERSSVGEMVLFEIGGPSDEKVEGAGGGGGGD